MVHGLYFWWYKLGRASVEGYRYVLFEATIESAKALFNVRKYIRSAKQFKYILATGVIVP